MKVSRKRKTRRKTKPDATSPAPETSEVLLDEGTARVVRADMLGYLDRLKPESFDACVTDPPYELGFMGKSWDSAGVSFRAETWAKVLRVLKPGGHLLAFGGTRTVHRIAVAIEDAGFEIRDMIYWCYGQGFPKSLNVSKAIDRKRNDDVRPVCRFLRKKIEESQLTIKQIAAEFQFHPRMVEHWAARDSDSQPTCATWEQWERLKELIGFGDEIDVEVWRLNGRKGKPGDAWEKRRSTGVSSDRGGFAGTRLGTVGNPTKDIPATPEAVLWDGWGTALKPATEPIILARKPISEKTVAANVLKHGTGAINVGACKIGTEKLAAHGGGQNDQRVYGAGKGIPAIASGSNEHVGRWPANLVLSHSPECVYVGYRTANSDGHYPSARGKGGVGTTGHSGQDGLEETYTSGEEVELYACVPGCPIRMLDEQSRIRQSGSRRSGVRKGLGYHGADGDGGPAIAGSSGGASRFFYCAKASTDERSLGLPLSRRNMHPTVKPVDLMRWLVRLVTPPDGTVLDPFAGSGTIGVAAVAEGFRAVIVERDPDSAADCVSRVKVALKVGKDVGRAKRFKLKGNKLKVRKKGGRS